MKKYEKDLQEKATAGRIFPSAKRDFYAGIERRGDRLVHISAVLQGQENTCATLASEKLENAQA